MSIKKKHEKLLDYLTIAKAADGDAICAKIGRASCRERV